MTDELPVNGTEVVTPPADAPKWFVDEGMPGQGERPSWLAEKFKSVADLGKSYAELEKRVGTVPDQYDVSKSKLIDPDYAPFQDFLQFAKEKRVPQEVMDKMVDSLDKYMDEFSINEEEEILKLGDNAKERITLLDNWAKANLSKDSYEALTSSVRNAESIKALEELRGKMMSNTSVVPNGNDGGTSTTATLDDLRAEMSTNLEKYKVDPVYRKDLMARMERVAATSGYVDKLGA